MKITSFLRKFVSLMRPALISKYTVYLEIAFRQNLAYSSGFWLIYLGLILRVLIYFYLWKVVASARQDLDVSQLITYSLLALIISRVVDSSVSLQMGSAIKDGSIITHLLRPMHYQTAMLSQALGEGIFNMITFGLISFTTAYFLFPIKAPATLPNFLLFLLSLAMGALLGGSLGYMFGALSFWTYNSWGVTVFKQLMFTLLSGVLIPIPLMPEVLRHILEFLPFQSMVNTPILIFLGQISTTQAFLSILVQISWVIAFLVIGASISRLALTQLTIQGG